MINRAGNKEKAKRVLNENGNLSGMVGMEILYRVIAAITSVLLGAMIAGGIGVVSAVVSAPFKLFGLAGIIIAYVLITVVCAAVFRDVFGLPFLFHGLVGEGCQHSVRKGWKTYGGRRKNDAVQCPDIRRVQICVACGDRGPHL